MFDDNYTIPSNNRELRLSIVPPAQNSIIPYQVITGNYDKNTVMKWKNYIIPYQVITGNYDFDCKTCKYAEIIPYQVITGNYDDRFQLAIVC